MKTKSARYLSMTLVLLFLVVGCDTGGGMTMVDWPQAEAYRIDCFVPDGASQMAFEATGAIKDEGTIEGEALPLDEGVDTWRSYRVLHGEQGDIVLYVTADLAPGGLYEATGTFEIMDGYGAYENLQGQGDFKARLDEALGLVEIFEGHFNGDQ